MTPNGNGTNCSFIGCMGHGPTYTDPSSRWYEPNSMLFGGMYPLRVLGSAYILSARAVRDVIVSAGMGAAGWVGGWAQARGDGHAQGVSSKGSRQPQLLMPARTTTRSAVTLRACGVSLGCAGTEGRCTCEAMCNDGAEETLRFRPCVVRFVPLRPSLLPAHISCGPPGMKRSAVRPGRCLPAGPQL